MLCVVHVRARGWGGGGGEAAMGVREQGLCQFPIRLYSSSAAIATYILPRVGRER